jgi:hypothetical protein
MNNMKNEYECIKHMDFMYRYVLIFLINKKGYILLGKYIFITQLCYFNNWRLIY